MTRQDAPESTISPGWASEEGHWYDRLTGEPRYTMVGKNGKVRATTLRDARPNGWVPGVSTITNVASRPGLQKWQAEQLLLAALTLPRQDGEPEKEWIGRVYMDSREQAAKAAERGTAIHAAIERYYRGEPVADEFKSWIVPVETVIAFHFGVPVLKMERSFAHPLGYGGKVDLHADGLLLDIKTKDGNLSDVKVYDEHLMQLAAYGRGLGLDKPRAGIVFVSRTEPKATVREVAPADLERGWQMFINLLYYWQAVNDYRPCPTA